MCGAKNPRIDLTMKAPGAPSNNLQEVDIMNSHLIEHISNENAVEVMRSVEFFIAAIIAISAIGLVCFAVA